jgi:hypothetical protein
MSDNIDVERYCGLSQQTDFQNWLKEASEPIYNELMSHLGKREGCGSNKNKMKMIYAKLKSMNKVDSLIEFVKKMYPHLIVRTEANSLKKPEKIDSVKVTNPNHHGVFPFYDEKLLTFPQRRIFTGSSYVEVNNAIINFIQHFLGTDFLILEENGIYYGYVEYFDKKYEKIIADVPMTKRHISVYKMKHGIK